MRAYRDVYRGFEIDYDPEHSGYDIYFNGNCYVADLESYDSCYVWIDNYIARNGLALGLRILQV